MNGIIEILKRDELDPKSASMDGSFEQREYGRVYTPACYNGAKSKIINSTLVDNREERDEVMYFSPYIH